MAKMETNTVLVLFGIAIIGFLAYSNGMFSTSPADDQYPDSEQTCDLDTQVKTTINFNEIYNPGTSATNTFAYKVLNAGNGDYFEVNSSTAGGTELEFSPFDKVQIIYDGADSSTTSTDWLGDIFEIEIPCKPTYRKNFEVYDIAASTLSSKAFNSAYKQLIASTNAEAVGVGGAGTINVEIQGTYEDAWGLNNMLVCIEWNNTAYDTVDVAGKSKVAKPSTLTTAQGWSEDCYEFPAIHSNDKLTFDIAYVADATNQPTVSDGNWTLSYLDEVAFRNDDTLAYEFGYEDESGNDIGSATETAVISLT